jgi:hypothetical protein
MFVRRSVSFASILAASLGACAAPAARAQVIVVPNALAATDGNRSVLGPIAPLRYMQIHDASQFAALSGPVFIMQFAQRPDAITGASGPQMVNVEIFLSTTSRSVAGLSSTFADNIGADYTRVFSGTQTLVTANLPGPGNTRQFDVVTPLTTPFRYDPRAGNLLVEFQVSSASGQTIRFDAVAGDPTVRAIFAGSPSATTGTIEGFAVVNQFTMQPVPEPSAVALVGLGMAGLLGYGWRTRREAVGNRQEQPTAVPGPP